MQRPLALALLLALVAVPLAPAAMAAHNGPCTHEYVDDADVLVGIVVDGVANSDPVGAAETLVRIVGWCTFGRPPLRDLSDLFSVTIGPLPELPPL